MNTLQSEDYSPLYTHPESSEDAATNPIGEGHVVLNYWAPQNTDISDDQKLRIFKFSGELIQEQKTDVNRDKKADIDGSVIRIDEYSVSCELYTIPKHRYVQLPLALFPSGQVRVGLPINLSIDHSGGIRKPFIKIRDLNKEELKEGSEIFDAIA